MSSVSQQYLFRPSAVLKGFKSAVHTAAFLASFIIGLDYRLTWVFAALILLSAVSLISEKEAIVRLTLSEQECLLDGEPIRITSEYFDTPWLLVLRFRRLTHDNLPRHLGAQASFRRNPQSALVVLPDTMAVERRRALSRQLRWQCFS